MEVKATSEQSFDALHTEMGLTARLQLQPDGTLDRVETRCLNPTPGTVQTYSIYALNGQQMIGDLMLPRRMGIAWDRQPAVEFTPTAAILNPPLDETIFRLGS